MCSIAYNFNKRGRTKVGKRDTVVYLTVISMAITSLFAPFPVETGKLSCSLNWQRLKFPLPVGPAGPSGPGGPGGPIGPRGPLDELKFSTCMA